MTFVFACYCIGQQAVKQARHSMTIMNSETKLINILKSMTPEKHDDLWNGVHIEKLKQMSGGIYDTLEHTFVDHLSAWASDAQLTDVVSSHERCQALVFKCTATVAELGMSTLR